MPDEYLNKDLKTQWDMVRSKVEAMRFNLDHEALLSKKEKNRILKNRAKRLALAFDDQQKKIRDIEIIKFNLAYENYAVESIYVKEVFPIKDLTYLPGLPDFILGIVSVRGEIISVVDVKKFFGLPEKGITNLNRVILLSDEKMTIGILADSIIGITSIYSTDIQTELPSLHDRRKEYFKGITQDKTILLDARKILTDPSIIINEEVL
jgi:purine-binding chemotaxis protein CheW